MKVQLKRGRRPKEPSKPKEEAADGSNTTAFSESDRENKVSQKRKWKSVDEALTVVEEQMQKPVKRSSLRSNKKSDSFDVLLVVRKFIFIVERRCYFNLSLQSIARPISRNHGFFS